MRSLVLFVYMSVYTINIWDISTSGKYYQNWIYRDFPGGPGVKNPPSNAGDTGSIPGQETKIPHATGQLSLCATTRDPMCQN